MRFGEQRHQHSDRDRGHLGRARSRSATPSTTARSARPTEIDCADGKSINVGGNNNKLTVKGKCANANIGGADNTVTIEQIDKGLSVVGFNNTVTYKQGDPKINDTGSGNKISKG